MQVTPILRHLVLDRLISYFAMRVELISRDKHGGILGLSLPELVDKLSIVHKQGFLFRIGVVFFLP